MSTEVIWDTEEIVDGSEQVSYQLVLQMNKSRNNYLQQGKIVSIFV